MNENLNLVKILKDCPKGTKFYSPVYGEIEFIGIETFISNPDPITIKWFKDENTTYLEYLRADGTFRGLGECIIFPSEEQRDWSKWHRPFVDGDVLSYQNKLYKNRTIYIYRYHSKMNTSYYVALSASNDFMIGKDGDALNNYNDTARFATEEEKQKIFDAIKKNGYEWNSEKKELKKIEEKFDISTLQPFDKVLVQDWQNKTWTAALFSHCHKNHDIYYWDTFVTTAQNSFPRCVPYNDETKHLLGTKDNAPDKYINW